MPNPWPSSLQQFVNQDNFVVNFGNTTITTDVDTGPVKKRSRFTRGIDTISVSFNLTVSQYTDFSFFYKTTCNNGVTIFQLNDPITSAPTNYRFMGTPSVRSIGGINFEVAFSLEVMSIV